MKAWSYSSLTDFLGCPRRYHLVRDKKVVPFTETEAIRNGNEVHKALELRLGEGKAPLPEKFQVYEPIAAKLDKPGVFVEKEIALTRNLKPTGWWSKDCWVRGKIDVGVKAKSVALLGDYKTGKVKSDPSQLELFAAMEMQSSPEVNVAKTMFIWLQYGKTTGATYVREQVPGIWEGFISKVQRLEDAYAKDKWLPKPSPLCGWCPLKNEHCEFRGCK